MSHVHDSFAPCDVRKGTSPSVIATLRSRVFVSFGHLVFVHFIKQQDAFH